MTENPKSEGSILGYDFRSPQSAKSSVSIEELRQLEQTLGWTDEDERLLRNHLDFFRSHADSMVDAWRAIIGAQQHLSQWFVGPDGKPDDEYKARLKRRFVQRVVDAAARRHDQAWLDYQEEIGLRHTPQKKNKIDNAHTPANVPLRYMIAFLPVVIDWMKAVYLHLALWSRAYAKESLW